MDATPLGGGGIFSDMTHFPLIKFVLHYAEYFKQHFPEGLFIVGSNFRNECLLGKALLLQCVLLLFPTELRGANYYLYVYGGLCPLRSLVKSTDSNLC